MATRQRVRSTKKAPVIPAQSSPIPENTADTEATAAFVSGVDFSAEEPAAEIPEARFVGEQVIYKSREERIAESAYLAAEARGFAPGYELEDWLKAEKEIDALLGAAGYKAY